MRSYSSTRYWFRRNPIKYVNAISRLSNFDHVAETRAYSKILSAKNVCKDIVLLKQVRMNKTKTNIVH